MIWTLDVINKQAIATGADALAKFPELAEMYGKQVLFMSQNHPFFISDGWLFTCQPPI